MDNRLIRQVVFVFLFAVFIYSVNVYANSIDLNLEFYQAGDVYYRTVSKTITDAVKLNEDDYDLDSLKIYARVISGENLIDNDITLRLKLEGESEKILVNRGESAAGLVLLGVVSVPCNKNLTYSVTASLAGTKAGLNYQDQSYNYNINLIIMP